MKKRALALLLTMVMLVSLLPVAVYADEAQTTAEEATAAVLPENDMDVSAEVPVDRAQNEDDAAASVQLVLPDSAAKPGNDTGMDNDDLFMGYLYRISGLDPQMALAPERQPEKDPNAHYVDAAMRTALNATNQGAYDALKEQIINVANNGGSTKFFVPLGEPTSINYKTYKDKYYEEDPLNTVTIDGENYYTYHELLANVLHYSEEEGIEFLLFNNLRVDVEVDLTTVDDYLLYDLPYDLYWHDKTATGGTYNVEGAKVEGTGDERTATYGRWVIFDVAGEFADGTKYGPYDIGVDSGKIAAAKTAKTTAQSIVEANAEKKDYAKLQAYLKAVDDAVSYNTAAAGGGADYGNPWQMVYVFDGDNSTNVVCEGYAKAFKYLCDLSTWKDSGFSCILVTGTMSGGTGAGPHMWNIVHLGDANYLVDPTNCDTGTAGAGDPPLLFMKKYASTVTDGYVFNTHAEGGKTTFVYDEKTKSVFTAQDLALSDQEYTEPTTCTVTFDLNGRGTAETKPVDQVINVGAVAAEPANPTDNEHPVWKFSGWFLDKACTNQYKFDTPITGDTTLYAQWMKMYMVFFDPNGGTGTIHAQPVINGEGTLDANVFTKDNNQFAGWALTSDGEVAYADGAEVTLTGEDPNVTLYAIWEPYSLKLHVTGGTGNIGVVVQEENIESSQKDDTVILTGEGLTDGTTYHVTLTRDGCHARTVAVKYVQGSSAPVEVFLPKFGDLNGDGQVNVDDMQCLFEFLHSGNRTGNLVSETPTEDEIALFNKVADVNGDESVDILDYQALYLLYKATLTA